MLQSVAKLSQVLVKLNITPRVFNAKGYKKVPFASGYSMTDETYGPKSFVYITAPSKEARGRLELELKRSGFKVNRQYSPLSNTAEIQVAYFLGCRYDE